MTSPGQSNSSDLASLPVIQVPIEDLLEAAELELRARFTSDPIAAAVMYSEADGLRRTPNFPVHDDPRTEEGAFGREVLVEFGAITPRTPGDDSWKTLPVRMIHDGGELAIELGPYTLYSRELAVLSRAIDVWRHDVMENRRLNETLAAAGYKYDPADVDPNATLQKYLQISRFEPRHVTSPLEERLTYLTNLLRIVGTPPEAVPPT